jgi:hypothetical protein
VAIRGNPWQSVHSIHSVPLFQACCHAEAKLSQSALIPKPTVGKYVDYRSDFKPQNPRWVTLGSSTRPPAIPSLIGAARRALRLINILRRMFHVKSIARHLLACSPIRAKSL